MSKRRRRITIGIVVAAVGALALIPYFFQGPDRSSLSLNDLESKLSEGRVTEVALLDRNHVVQGTLRDGTEFESRFPSGYTSTITKKIVRADVPKFDVDAQRSSPLLGVLFELLPIILVIGLLVFFFTRLQGGGRLMGFGKARAKAFSKEQPQISFDDVAGLDEAVEELREIKDFLESPKRFRDMGAKIPKGVLLFGPPGTGKTLLARAVAGEAGVPFFSISGSDFVEMYVGVGASRVRDLFAQAKAAAPAIVFVDEIDAVGRHRGAGVGGGHDEREQTLNQLLVEMDGFDQGTGVILLASTNRPDILDPALLRPGRFDRQIVVDRPDLEGRKKILGLHARGKPIAPGVELTVIARRTAGFTGADLANLVNEAAILSTRKGLELIGLPQLEEASERVIAGPERKSRIISDRERHVIAYHEGGHALVAHALPNADPVHKVSIIPRGRALGYTLTLPTEDKFLVTRSELVDELAMLMGGRTAEELVFADPTTGAQNDIDRATTIARQMVTEWGMSESLGPLRLGQPRGEVFLGRDFSTTPDYSDDVAAQIDAEVRNIVERAHAVARSILETNRSVLDALVVELVEHETLEVERVQQVFASVEPFTGSGTGRAAAAAATDVGRPGKPVR